MFKPPSNLAKKVAIAALAVGTSAAFVPSASAFTFYDSTVEIDASDIDRSFTIFFDGNVKGASVADLSSQATFTFLGFRLDRATTQAIFDINLANTSSNGITSRSSALGFNVDGGAPIEASVEPSGLFSNAITDASLANPGDVGVCFTDGVVCEDGANGGVDNDPTTANLQQGNFTATVAVMGSVDRLALSNFGVRYQSINGNGYVGESGTGQFRVLPRAQSQSIPEPGTVGAVLLAGLWMLHYRRKKLPAAP